MRWTKNEDLSVKMWVRPGMRQSTWDALMKRCKYRTRGDIVTRARVLRHRMAKNEEKLDFREWPRLETTPAIRLVSQKLRAEAWGQGIEQVIEDDEEEGWL